MSEEIFDVSLSEIQKNAQHFDNEELHYVLMEKVNSGDFETYFEALKDYVEENDINVDELSFKKLISPSLYGILYREALDNYMLKDNPPDINIESFF